MLRDSRCSDELLVPLSREMPPYEEAKLRQACIWALAQLKGLEEAPGLCNLLINCMDDHSAEVGVEAARAITILFPAQAPTILGKFLRTCSSDAVNREILSHMADRSPQEISSIVGDLEAFVDHSKNRLNWDRHFESQILANIRSATALIEWKVCEDFARSGMPKSIEK